MATGAINGLERSGDEKFVFLCVVCKGKNKNTEAEIFCSDCHDYYCSTCVKCHDVIPVLKTHQILDKSTAPLPAVPTERCKEHKDKPVDMYCKNHNVVGCSTCMLVKHSSCIDKLYIPEFIKGNSKATNSNNVEEQLAIIAQSLKALQEAFFKEKEEIKSNRDNVLKEIGTFRQKINQLLDRFEENVVQELERRFKSLSDKIGSSLNELQATTIEIKAAQDHLRSAEGNMPQKFVKIMQSNHRQVVASAKEKIEVNESKVTPTEIYFLANRKLQALFSEIKDLGSVRVREKLRITGRQLYRVKVNSDFFMKCDISSVCTTNDGTIILADYHNCKLKRLDSSLYTLTDWCDIPPSPYQVCAITDRVVAISCFCTRLIQFVNVGRKKKMKKTRQIKTGFQCQGLAYADGRLFVSDKTLVYMFSLSGERLQQLYNDQSVQKSLSNIIALAINVDKSRIYVVDLVRGFIILDTKGQLVGQYNGDKLRRACDVCVVNNDNVLVCGNTSRNVLQFSPEGMLIGEIVKN